MAVELISQKSKGRCTSSLQVLVSSQRPVFLNFFQHANSFLKYTNVRGSPDLRAVAQWWAMAHRLRTSGL